MCLSPLYSRYSAVDQPEYVRRMENNLPYPSCVQEHLRYVQAVCVCVCVRESVRITTTCPSGVALNSAVISSIGLYVMVHLWRNSMWDLGSKNESHGRKKNSIKSLEGLDLLKKNIMLHQKPNQNPQLWLSEHEQQLRAHRRRFAAISAAEFGITKKRWCIFWMFRLLQKVHVWGKKCHISHKSGHQWVLLWSEQLPGIGLAQRQ